MGVVCLWGGTIAVGGLRELVGTSLSSALLMVASSSMDDVGEIMG